MSHLCVFRTYRCKPWMRCQLWVLFQLDTQASISLQASQVSTGRRMKRVRWKRKDALKLIFVEMLCVLVCLSRFFSPVSLSFFSFSFALCSIFYAPVLWTGGCPGLQYPVRSHYNHCGGRKGQMRDGKTKRLTEQDESRQVGRGEENGALCRQSKPLWNFSRNWSRLIRTLSTNLNNLKASCVYPQSLLIKWKECQKVPFNRSGQPAQWVTVTRSCLVLHIKGIFHPHALLKLL